MINLFADEKIPSPADGIRVVLVSAYYSDLTRLLTQHLDDCSTFKIEGKYNGAVCYMSDRHTNTTASDIRAVLQIGEEQATVIVTTYQGEQVTKHVAILVE